jgi:predicted nucleotidyltransferase
LAAPPPLPPVRLRPEEIAAVKRIVAEHFGANAEVRVFGSRARLDLKGGDLDLHVVVPGDTPPFGVEIRVANVLEKAMDDRHVDLILLGTADTPRRIDEVALATGVLL